LLGLPLGRPLLAAAFKRTAKHVHPDAGGSDHAFRELCAARDVLMRAL
jgi:hypothetical protein